MDNIKSTYFDLESIKDDDTSDNAMDLKSKLSSAKNKIDDFESSSKNNPDADQRLNALKTVLALP